MGLLSRLFNKDKTSNTSSSPSPSDIVEKLDQATDEKELANYIRSKIDEVRSSASRIAHQGVWMQNCAYTIGFSGLYFNTSTRSFQPINKTAGFLRRNRMYVNKILPTLQNRLARLTKNPPRFDVRPNDQTQEAKDNARFKLDILVAKWDELRANLERQQAVMWTQQCGHAYLGIFWDDSLGRYTQDPLTGEGMFEGDIRLEIISPFEMFPDPLARNLSEAQYLIRAKVRPLTYFRDQFGQKGNEVNEEETWLLSAQFEARVNSMNTRGFSSSSSQSAQRNTAIELTYFERPSKKNPRGRLIIVANGVVLANKELPTGKIPLAKMDDIVVGGKYYSESVVTHIRPIQDQYNEVIRRRADWVKKLLNGKILSPRGNELIKEAFTDESGEIIQYTPVPNAPNGGEPRPLDIPNIPSWAYQEEDKLDAMFGELSGIGEVSKGQLPSASIPALGMQILQEADDTRIGVEILNHEFCYSQLGGHILDYVQMFYKTPRKMKFAGKQALVIKDVQGDELEGDNDVIVIPGSTIPGSKALRRQEIINAYTQGLLGDPADPKVRQNVLGMLELGDVGEIWLDSSLDSHRIELEKEAIEAEQMPEIDEGFNHTLHIQELNRYRKSDKWELLSPISQEIFMAVREEHLRFLGEQTGAIPAGSEEMSEIQGIQGQMMQGDEDMPLSEAPVATSDDIEVAQGAPAGGV